MGFAGQVFAARVAVGLAIPSPAAFSSAGEAIGKFASGMYKDLQQQNIAQAQKNTQVAASNMQKARNRLSTHIKKQDKEILSQAEDSINSLTSKYKEMGQTTSVSMKRLGEMKRMMPRALKTQLFANVGKDLTKAQRYTKMMQNFVGMEQKARVATIENLRKETLALERQKIAAEDGTKAGKEKVRGCLLYTSPSPRD